MTNLNASLFQIGIQQYTKEQITDTWINVEKVILKALLQVSEDRKLISLLLSWTDTYGDRLIKEKLIKIYKKMEIPKEKLIWFHIFFAFIT